MTDIIEKVSMAVFKSPTFTAKKFTASMQDARGFANAAIAALADGELSRVVTLITATRNKLERRFQASDFVPERIGGKKYALATEICTEVMTQIREAHKYIDEADIKLRAYLTALKNGGNDGQ